MLAPLHQEMGAKAIAEQSLGTKLCEIVFSQTRYIKNCTLYFGLKKKKGHTMDHAHHPWFKLEPVFEVKN